MLTDLRFSIPGCLLILSTVLLGCAEESPAENPSRFGKRPTGPLLKETVRADSASMPAVPGTEDLSGDTIPGSEEATVTPPKPTHKAVPPTIAETGPYPKAVPDQMEYRFGRMPLGGESEHTFTIRNDGEAELKLVAGESTCQCTKFQLTKKVLQPGETGELIVRWKLAKVNLQFQHGGPVYTNDPENKILHYAVSGAVDNAIHVSPNSLWEMEAVPYGEEGTYQGFVSSAIYDSFKLDDVRSESGNLKIDVQPVTAAEAAERQMLSGYKITVKLPADHPPGIIEDKLSFKPDKVDKEAQIGFKVLKEGPVAIVGSKGGLWVGSENKLRLGRFSMKAGMKAQLILAVNDKEIPEEGFEVTAVESKPRYLKTKLEKMSSVKKGVSRYSLEIAVPPGSPRASYPGTKPARMQVKTNHPEHESIDLQISFKTF